MQGSVAWITIAPVKALALVHRDEVELEPFGVRENRRFYLVDDNGRMINGKVVGPLVRVVPDYDDATGRLALHLPDGDVVAGDVAVGEPLTTSFFGRPVPAGSSKGLVRGALGVGRPLPPSCSHRRTGPRRRPRRSAGVSLVGTASLEALANAAGVERVDGRRFRMLFGVDGVPAHAEDAWIGRRLGIGDAVVRLRGNVGRCAVTTQNPDTGVPDLDTLRALGEYRGDVETSEPLPMGVWGEVVEPGRVRLGDPVAPE